MISYHLHLIISESVHVCVFVLLRANFLIFEKAGLLNNYVNPVLNTKERSRYS